MLISITEFNAWENERWTYVLDMEKQDGEVLNNLMIFIRIANQHFEEVKGASAYRIFAASRYNFKFYKSLDLTKKLPCLQNKNSALIMASDPGYNSHSFDLSVVVSAKRVKSAMLAMRGKNENILYKNFDSLFLKSKALNK